MEPRAGAAAVGSWLRLLRSAPSPSMGDPVGSPRSWSRLCIRLGAAPAEAPKAVADPDACSDPDARSDDATSRPLPCCGGCRPDRGRHTCCWCCKRLTELLLSSAPVPAAVAARCPEPPASEALLPLLPALEALCRTLGCCNGPPPCITLLCTTTSGDSATELRRRCLLEAMAASRPANRGPQAASAHTAPAQHARTSCEPSGNAGQGNAGFGRCF
jgi:hypothetical protein